MLNLGIGVKSQILFQFPSLSDSGTTGRETEICIFGPEDGTSIWYSTNFGTEPYPVWPWYMGSGWPFWTTSPLYMGWLWPRGLWNPKLVDHISFVVIAPGSWSCLLIQGQSCSHAGPHSIQGFWRSTIFNLVYPASQAVYGGCNCWSFEKSPVIVG